MSKQVAKTDKQSRYEFHLGRYREYAGAATGELFAIWTDQLWENEYDSFDEFLKVEVTDFSRSRVYALLKAESVKRLSAVQKLDTDKLKTSHFEEVSKIEDDNTKVEVLKEVLQDCKEEGREPTAKDFRKAVREHMPDPEPEANGKAHTPEREPGEDEPPEPTAEEFHKMSLKLRASYVATAERLRRDIDEFKKRCPDMATYERFAKASNETVLALRAWKLK